MKSHQLADSARGTTSGERHDSRYLDFFRCFNREEYFEAHEVLEDLWRKTYGPRRDFYQGLIQTAAAFLKLKQNKPAPAARLAERALAHLENYRPVCDGLDVERVIELLQDVLAGRNILAEGARPHLEVSEP
jgi:predicted metal-dependent hydrolase